MSRYQKVKTFLFVQIRKRREEKNLIKLFMGGFEVFFERRVRLPSADSNLLSNWHEYPLRCLTL